MMAHVIGQLGAMFCSLCFTMMGTGEFNFVCFVFVYIILGMPLAAWISDASRG